MIINNEHNYQISYLCLRQRIREKIHILSNLHVHFIYITI